MTLVFDAANAPFDQYVMLLIPGAALLLTLFIALRGGKRKSVIIGGMHHGVPVFADRPAADRR